MQYTPEQSHLIAAFTLGDYVREREITRKVIGAVPDGKPDYAPDDKSMPAIKLARHLAGSELFFLSGVIHGKFEKPDTTVLDALTTSREIVQWYDENLPPAIAKVKGLSGEKVGQSVDFFGVMQAPAFIYLQLMIKHSAHHRGQLCAYIRPMGGKVPSVYGPSADEGM